MTPAVREQSTKSRKALGAGTRLGPYEVVSLLGAGGMGEVYRARDTRLGRDVALKVLHEEVLEAGDRLRRFEQEARAVAALNHPNILTVYDVGTQNGVPYVVTELLEGESLREVVLERAPTQRQVLQWAVQTAQGLSAAHQKGVVHRDIKPENLFLTIDGRIKILDFGLAKQADRAVPGTREDTAAASLTKPGVVMGTVAYMSPEQAQGCSVDARSDIFSFGVVLYELLSGRHPFRRETVAGTLSAILQETPPSLAGLDASIPRAVDGIVGRCLEKRREERFQGAHDLGLALETVLAAPAGAAALEEVEERSPYPGLASFTEKDASVFFGREDEVEVLWERIRARHLLAVIGPSGAGKTSFIRAGVVAGRPEGWAAIVSTPGRAPLRGLGQALGPELAGDPEALRKIAGFEDPETAFELLSRWRRGHGDVLVVVDQFEELFTLCTPESQQAFSSFLARLADDAGLHVVLSLRDDFLIRCHEQPALADVFEHLTPLLAVSGGGLRRAVVEPAKKRGYRFEDDALVDEMIKAVEGNRAALPLLAFAVSCLWEKRDREKKLLTRQAYEDTGGVAGSLAQHAEATLDRIGGERQSLVREIFRNLVTAQGTRAVCEREELLSAFPDRPAAEDVLRQLVDSRLITSYEMEDREGEAGHHRVEVAHESLLKAWPRLVRWQTQDEDGALLRDQLKQAAHLWEEKGRTGDLLWTGTAYQEFELWRGRYPGALTSLEDQFAKAMADKAQRRKRLVRAAVAAVVLVSTGVAIAIGLSRHKAVVAAQHAEASKLLALAQLKLPEDPTEALALTTASLELADTNEARLFALRTIAQAPPAWEVVSDIGDAQFPAFSPDGRFLAVAGHSSDVGVWNEKGGPPFRLQGHEPSPGFPGAAWVSDEMLVTGLSASRQVHVWSIPAGKKLRTIDFGAPSEWQIGQSRLFAMTDVPSSPGILDLRSWRLPDGEPEHLGRVDAAKLGMTSAAFEPHGRGWLYTVGTTTRFLPLPIGRGSDRVISQHAANVVIHPFYGRPGFLAEYDETGENRLLHFPESGPPVTTIFPRPDSAPQGVYHSHFTDRWVLSDPEDFLRVRLWQTGTLPGARPLELRREGSWYAAMSEFDPLGKLVVATTHSMSRLTFWPLQRPPIAVDGYQRAHRPLAFSPDSKWLATSWTDNRLRLWPLPGSNFTEVKVLNAPAENLWMALAFDPNGEYLFAVGANDSAWIVPLDGSPGRKLDEYSKDTLLMGAAVSPTGRRVATAFFFGKGSKTLRVRDVETGKVRLFELPVPPAPSGTSPTLTGYEGGVGSIAFLDDSTLFTGGQGGIRRWNLNTGTNELILAAPGLQCRLNISSDRNELLFCKGGKRQEPGPVSCGAINLSTGAARSLGAFADASSSILPGVTTQGPAFAMLGRDGSVRVGLRSGGEPHWLLGHAGRPDRAAISPDQRWVASTGEDNTLRLWPMPDLSRPPLQALPHDELVAKLKSLTNIRAVRDAASATGWKIELGPFPGWKNLPSWQP